jgi:hypothetical protein
MEVAVTVTSPQKKRAKRGKVGDGASKNERARVNEGGMSAFARLAGNRSSGK